MFGNAWKYSCEETGVGLCTIFLRTKSTGTSTTTYLVTPTHNVCRNTCYFFRHSSHHFKAWMLCTFNGSCMLASVSSPATKWWCCLLDRKLCINNRACVNNGVPSHALSLAPSKLFILSFRKLRVSNRISDTVQGLYLRTKCIGVNREVLCSNNTLDVT